MLSVLLVAFSCLTAVLLVHFKIPVDPGLIGLSVTYTLSLSGMLQFMVRQSALVETFMTSVERIISYGRELPSEKLDNSSSFVGGGGGGGGAAIEMEPLLAAPTAPTPPTSPTSLTITHPPPILQFQNVSCKVSYESAGSAQVLYWQDKDGSRQICRIRPSAVLAG